MGAGADDRCVNGYYNVIFFVLDFDKPGHPERCRRQLGVNRHVFCRLVWELEQQTWLCPTRFISSEEQVAIFLRIARTGQSNFEMQERFQRSGDTISKCVCYLIVLWIS
jgi:hypothetical protein